MISLINSAVSVLTTTQNMMDTTTNSFMDSTTYTYIDTTTTFQPETESTIHSTPNLTTMHSTPNMTTMSSTPWTDLTTGFIPETTETPDDSTYPVYVGFISAALAIFLYGTMFIPVKKFETGDGMFFQWVLCLAIWVTGLVVQLIRHSPEFYPICMLGGFLWATGNICVVPIVKTVGLGLGFVIWSMLNLMSGWATGRFGLFGTDKESLSNYALNDVGVVLAVCSAVIFSLVKNNVDGSNDDDIEIVPNEETPLIRDTLSDTESSYSNSTKSHHETIVINDTDKKTSASINQTGTKYEEGDSFIDRLSPTAKRIVGLFLSVMSGLIYAQLFTPAKYLQDHGHSKNGLDYVFSTFCGIILTSTVYFLIYAVAMKNNPKVYPRVIIPAIISGIMWGVATSGWFVANKVLSNSVAFPIVTTGPGIIASVLGVVMFREVTGMRNILVMLLGMTVAITGSVLSGLSF